MTEAEKKTEVDPKVEEGESSDEHEHEHVHGEHCNHDNDGEDDKKGNRGEKKFKKAMTKMGLKSVSGINRVTIKKGKAVTPLLFSSSSVSMIPMCGNLLEPRMLTLSSVSPT